jgi:peptidyl-prolyl cis-trans isomerase C
MSIAASSRPNPLAPAGDAAEPASPAQPEAAGARGNAAVGLLHREAQRLGLLPADDPGPDADGTISRAAAEAIERLIEQEVRIPEPDEAECRRHHAAHPARFGSGERVRARHVLYAVTDGVDIGALRRLAEQALLDLRAEPEGFAARARETSNCPSGADGGELGWLRREDCADEFSKELFGHGEVGVLPRLVHSRFGLHVVEVLAREPGHVPPFESVRGAVALSLRQRSFATALRQYVRALARRDGVGLAHAQGPDPLVQ